MKINYKLLALPILVLISLVYISFLFSSEIDRLKKQIDNIYFGNFIPVHRLHIIKEEYKNILFDQKNFDSSRKSILLNWEFYNSQYKSKNEREVVNKINNHIKRSFTKNTNDYYKYILTQVDLLIQYEVSSASIQRKKFLQRYEEVSDYLLYNQIFIIVSIAVFILFTVITTMKSHNKLEYLVNKYKSDSITDGLTGLYNRKYFDTIMDETTAISRDNEWQSVFVMIDIDFFKQFNDTYGHDAGDIALKAVAQTLDTLFDKEYDYVFRLGGEEFGIIVFNITQQTLEKRLQQLQQAIASKKVVHSASKTGYLTLSMGVVLINQSTYNLTRTQLYKIADQKLYISKENGRDQYTL
jgi:diguanylate cyclase (GGDEF)-like protein